MVHSGHLGVKCFYDIPRIYHTAKRLGRYKKARNTSPDDNTFS
jgi:hypothetical protein